MSIIKELEDRVLKGYKISFDEAMQLVSSEEYEELFAAANKIREKFRNNKVDLCTIMNAKSGKCSENCKFCAQSAHYSTEASVYALKSEEEIIKEAKENESCGAHRFSLVTSGKAINEEDFEKIVNIYKRLKKETNLKLCASLGCITYLQAVQLKKAGVEKYHHNVETSSSFYNEICSTHSYEDRISTIRNILDAGLDMCCGGIIGMGESMEDRIKMAFEIKELGIKSVPINILNPVKGTPLENSEIIDSLEALKIFSVYRFILPDASIRYAGGRTSLGEYQSKGLKAGVDGVLVGNYLTTVGNKILDDIKMIKEEGLEV